MATSYGAEQTYTFYGITFKVRVFATANITSQTDTSATVTFTSGIQYTASAPIGGTFHLAYQYLGTSSPSTEKLAERMNTAYFEELPNAASWTEITAFSNTVTKTINKTQAAQAYTFHGEAIGASSISYISSFPSEAASGASVSISIPAITSYAITYNANGGSGAPSAQTKWYGQSITLSSTQPTRTSYAFKRWNTNTADTGTAYSPGSTYSANAALALYAIWNPIISYNANGGSGAPEAQTKTFGTALTLSSTVPMKSGYAFAVWNTASNGTGSSYDAGGSYTSNTAATLYAIWTPVVSYNANGGSGAPEAQTKPLSQALTLSSTVPTKAGFVFREWNTSSDGSGTSYQPGGTYSSTSTATMYAIWDAALTISSFDVERADSSGNTDEVGTYLKCTVAWSTTVDGVSAAFSCGSATSTVELSGSSGTTVGLLPASAVPTSDYTATVVVEDEVASKTASATTTAASTGYSLPAVQSITVARCDSHGTIEDDGLYALVTVAWKVSAVGSQTAPQSLTIKAYDGSAEVDSVTETSFSTASGTYMHVMGYGSTFSADRPYTFTATIADVVTTASKSDVMPIAYFPFDVLAGGHGVAFGKPAFQSELMDVGYDIHSDGEIEATDASNNLHRLTEKANQSDVVTGIKGNAEGDYRKGNVNLTPANIGAVDKGGDTMTGSLAAPTFSSNTQLPNIYGGAPSSPSYSTVMSMFDAAGNQFGYIEGYHGSDGYTGPNYAAVRSINGSNVYSSLLMAIGPNGERYMGFNAGRIEANGTFQARGDVEVNNLIDFHGGGNWSADYTTRIVAPRNDGELWQQAANGAPMYTVYRGGSPEIYARMYADGEGGNFGWTAPDGSYNEVDSWDNAHTRIYNYYGGNYHFLQWERGRNYDLNWFSDYVIARTYTYGMSRFSGYITSRETVPDGYKLLTTAPIVFMSGDEWAFATDRSATQNGSVVDVGVYVHNPNNALLNSVFQLLFIRAV